MKIRYVLICFLVAPLTADAGIFDFFTSKPQIAVPFLSEEEMMKRILSIKKSAEHCTRARVVYYKNAVDLKGGEAACDDYADWKKNFFPRYEITAQSMKSKKVLAELSYFAELELID